VPAGEAIVYSREDADVLPPVLADPQLAQSALPELDRPVVNTLELLVAEDGSVERVRMLSRPRRMADMMVLSGVKMWKFRPAFKDGRPVRYLTVLDWTVTP
jgi:outer membrane biosynthesis protein TonB